jgi:hypothetical protein
VYIITIIITTTIITITITPRTDLGSRSAQLLWPGRSTGLPAA